MGSRRATGTAADRRARAWGRIALGAAGLALTALPLRPGRVGRREARVFRAVNGLPEALFVPTWVVMQGGALGAALAAAAVAFAAGRRRLGFRLATAGSTTWALSKGVKRVARRGRPATFLAEVHLRGRPAAGLGYLSGHAGVAVALAGCLLPEAGRRGRAVIVTSVPVVGLARVYVGTHLPLDVVGGAALGLAVDGALSLAKSPG